MSLPDIMDWEKYQHQIENHLPNIAEALLLAREEIHLWGLAGARGISYFLATAQGVS